MLMPNSDLIIEVKRLEKIEQREHCYGMPATLSLCIDEVTLKRVV